MWIKKLPLSVNKKTYFIIEVILVCIVLTVTTLGGHFCGVIYGLLIALLCSPILALRIFIIRVPYFILMPDDEFDPQDHEHIPDDTLILTYKKNPGE